MSNPRELLSPTPVRVINSECAVSTGSTLLNLACSDHPRVGFLMGGYYYLVGDSASGKTFLSLTCFAEACINPAFDNYRLIFDDVEGGALMNIRKFFGKAVEDRMEPPSLQKGFPVMSDTVESFYYHLYDALKGDRPFIYVLDSQDALTSDASDDKFQKRKNASESGEEAAGSYGDGKAKFHSEHLRLVLSKIRKKKCILIIIGQTRDNLGFGFEKKTRSGGRALRFYANLEIWSSVAGKLKRLVRGRERTLGSKCLVELRKNRITGKIGKDRSVVLPIYYDFGVDNVGSCVDFLVKEKHWKKASGTIEAPEVGASGTRSAIIQHIENRGMEKLLIKTTATVWRQIEAECSTTRKSRYAQ